MKTDIWMPLYIGDYLKDTIGLTYAEHGAYLLALMKYWSKGEALTRAELKEVCRGEIDRVGRFFTMHNDRWHHKRVDVELAKAAARSKAAQANSRKGVLARRAMGLLPEKDNV